MDFIVPDGWTLPARNTICLCECGLIYYDNDRTQADYDEYYQKHYGNTPVLACDENHKRQDEIVEMARKLIPDKGGCIVDFGGGEGYITKRLNELGYASASTVNVCEVLPDRIDLLICSHVLEHIYDLRGAMDKLASSVRAAGGAFLIEVPDAVQLLQVMLPIWDYNQGHINKFAPWVLDKLLAIYDYYPVHGEILPLYTFGYCYRVIYMPRKSPMEIYRKSQEHINYEVNLKLQALNKITVPVIVWGCGDLLIHLLTKAKLNILQFVDLNEDFRGSSIGGIPILDHVESDAPILVMVQNQEASILKTIKERGYKNEVIVL
jgi:hypothetical protein